MRVTVGAVQLATQRPVLTQCLKVCSADLDKVLLPATLCREAFRSWSPGQGAASTVVGLGVAQQTQLRV